VIITVDTNILVRVLVDDHAEQAAMARALLSNADLIVVPIPVLCELVWVLKRGYRRSSAEIVTAITELLKVEKMEMDRSEVERGLQMLAAGGDFADGAIACLGEARGAGIFASFDRQAVALLRAGGTPAAEPAEIL
jgi:predicted nucleic-acid-binding protein